MSTRFILKLWASIVVLHLALCSPAVADPAGVSKVSALSTEELAAEVAYKLKELRPEFLDRKVHWFVAIDRSGSTSGYETQIKETIEHLLRYTAVSGDRITRLSFGPRLEPEMPGDPPGFLEKKGAEGYPLEITQGLTPSKELGTAMSAAQKWCREVIERAEPSHLPVALLITDHGIDQGEVETTEGAVGDGSVRSRVRKDGEPSAKSLLVYIWVGGPEKLEAARGNTEVRRVNLEHLYRIPGSDPDGWKRKVLDGVPWGWGVGVLVLLGLVGLRRSSLELRSSGPALSVPFTGAGVPLVVHSDSASFHLERDRECSWVEDGTVAVQARLAKPWAVFSAPELHLQTLQNGNDFRVQVNQQGFSGEATVVPGSHLLSLQTARGMVVKETDLKVQDTGLRLVIIGCLAWVLLGLGYLVFSETISDAWVTPPTPSETIIEREPL